MMSLIFFFLFCEFIIEELFENKMSSGRENFFQESTMNVDSSFAEVESLCAIGSADPPVQQQRKNQNLCGSLLVPSCQDAAAQKDQNPQENLLPQNNMLPENNLGNMLQHILCVPRLANNQQPQLNFFPGQTLSREVHPRGRIPRLFSGSSSRTGKEVVEGDTSQDTQQRKDSPWVHRPIGNRLYDPAFAANGLPVDPHLRALKRNPAFCNNLKRKQDKSLDG
ncbi:uncharacterized protein LOC132060742 [Lycium ferocissimum]|uniref:uncharacterized protein LOC132060742 n=1 Tax=Lycium ferocissimum TaxID=112874 RepID=UPI002816681C|nr:uncharacterized protein LOC132060742 [Lycium ferocissimum]